MNGYKIRYMLEFIRRKGRLPRDTMGNLLSPEDILAWYGLDERLTPLEQACLKKELAGMVEAEAFIEQLGLEGR